MALQDGKIIIGTSVDMYGMNTGLKKIEKSFKNLSRLSGGAIGVIGLVKLGKAALDAASDLQEVQNIVDVTFAELDEAGNVISDMRGKIENFADTCIEKFGMSELAAKQTAGSFMAMGRSMGLSMEEASNMSISLTGLTGDMASFYNISQDYARVALSAVYTGETETLKRYGIILTEANLQQYANTKGIQQSVKQMDARSKALLRYQYILDSTKHIEGDFARTSGSWANQTRLLKEQWTVFLNVLGTGLITVLTPVLRMLNAIIAAMTRMLKVIGATLTNIFGIKWQTFDTTVGSVGSSAGDAADAIGDMGDAAEKAGKQAKEALAPYDELNVIQQDTASGGGGGGAGGGGVGDFDIPIADSSMLDDLKDKLKSFDSLFDLGRDISTKIEKALRGVDWEKAYEGARTFGTGLADFLNGLITPGLFGAVGMTIASALNTAIYTALSFGTTFDWKNLGSSLAAGVNEFFDTFDFGALADAIDAWVQGLWDALWTFIHDVEWKDVFKGIFDFLKHLDLDTVEIIVTALLIKKIGKIIWGFDFAKWFGKALAPKIAEAAKLAFLTAPEGTGLRQIVTDFFTLLFGSESVGAIAATITGAIGIIAGAFLSIVNIIDMWKEGFSWLNEILTIIGGILVGIGLVVAGIVSAPVAIVAAIAGLIAAAVGLIAAYHQEIIDWLSGIGEWIWVNVLQPIGMMFSDILTAIGGFFSNAWEFIKGIWQGVAEWFHSIVTGPIGQWFAGLWQTVKDIFYTLWLIVQAIWKVVADWFNTNVITPVATFFTNLANGIKLVLTLAWTAVQGVWNTVANWFSTNVIEPVKAKFEALKTAITNGVSLAWDLVKMVLGTIANYVKQHVIDPISNFFSGLWSGIISGLKGALNTCISSIESLLNSIVSGINKFLGGLETIGKGAAAITGKSYNGISKVGGIKLPRLAQGAVIPPNREFMAVLGDQKSGTNIETPLDTMIQAFETALSNMGVGGNNQPIVLQLNGKQIAQAVWDENEKRYKQTGKAFVY